MWRLAGVITAFHLHQKIIKVSKLNEAWFPLPLLWNNGSIYLSATGPIYLSAIVGYVLRNRAKVVTRNMLCWLEKNGQLSRGTAQCWVNNITSTRDAEYIAAQVASDYYTAKIGSSLPIGLREPLLAYLTHLREEKMLTPNVIQHHFLANFRLCHYLFKIKMMGYGALQIKHVDAFLQECLSSRSFKDLRLKRVYIRALQSLLRSFLYFLFTKGYLAQDISSGLIAPPCYRYHPPQKLLSPQALECLVESIDRSTARGRRTYALVLLSMTYGLRPSDIARLKLDDLDWKARRISIVQSKTGAFLTLPLEAQVAQAIYDYIYQDRPRAGHHRQLFLALYAPYLPVQAQTLGLLITSAMHAAHLSPCGARALRGTMATHLLEQGEGLSTVQEILGHRCADTTQRYVRTSLHLMRKIFDEDER
jgi:site-specific recombinase XerD